MRLFTASNVAFAHSLVAILVLIFSIFIFASSVFAETTGFRSANIITTDGSSPYANLNNCSATDGNTCDRALASSFANLYFRDFGTYADFGIPEDSNITKVRIKVTGKTSTGIYVGLSSGQTYTANCQFPSDLWTMYQLGGSVINVQNFVTNVTQQGGPQAVGADCLQPYNFENKNFIWKINYSSGQNWSANIDNFEIAFDYEPGVVPTPTPTPTPTPKTPLILIPGIGGSELKTTQTTIWDQPDGHGGTFTHIYPEEKVWVNNIEAGKPGNDDYFDILRMFDDGQTSQANFALTGNLFDGYQDTINFFTSNGYVLNKDFFLFPYDWRKDIVLTAPLLDQKINEIKTQTGSQKVDIIAHSMGGLVARNYVADTNRASKVRKLFTLGVPHLGSVDALKGIKYGNCLTDKDLKNLPFCLGITTAEVKDVIRNMISGYELVPSREYYNFYDGQDKDHLYPYQVNGNSLNYDQIKSFLTDSGHNTPLFGPSESFHTLDKNLGNTNGVEVINIAGSGLPTLGQIIEKSVKDFFGNSIHEKDGFTINGDETVPLFSASLNDSSNNKSLLGNAKVFYTKQEHGNLVASGPALNLVKNILSNDVQLPEGVSVTPYSFTGTRVSVHSPVDIHAYDSVGNHTGSTSNGDFEANIPGSSYDTLGDAKFIWLSDNGQYDIKFEATDQGSFDFKIRKYENDENTETVLYNDVPLTENTLAEATFNTSGEPPTLLVDEEGDGIIDLEVDSSAILTGDDIFDSTPPQTTVELSGTAGLNGWYKSVVTVTLNSQDEDSGSGILKTEYSLDNGATVNIYTEPFEISAEKINKLKFRSIDKAGNEEKPKEIEVKIDKTVPEAKIFVDPNKQDLAVVGVDKNSTTVIRSNNTLTKKKDDAFYLITDAAGNTLKLDVRERDKDKKDKFRIYSIQYNNDPPKILEDNHFNVSYNGKKERTNVKEQNFELKGEVKIRIQYDVKKNKSTIIVKETKQEKVKEVRDGLTLLQLFTISGNLKAKY